MNIKIYEIKKIITSPILIILTMIFIAFNVFNIYSNSYIKDDLKAINKIIGEFGYEINDKKISDMKFKSNVNLNKINKLTQEKFNTTFATVDDFIKSKEFSDNFQDNKIFSKEEKEFFIEASLLELYLEITKDTVNDYENLDMIEIGESQIKEYNIEDKAKDIVRENYKNLQVRFEQLKENKEHENFFFLGEIYKTHSLLFSDVLSKCVYEIVILAVLISTYLINYEFDNKTSLLVYSTRRGRKNANDKLQACIIASSVISILILGITFLVYFINFNYSNVFNVPVSNAFNWEELPYISWFNITIKEKLILSSLVILICVSIVSYITFIIAKLVKNSYIVFFIFFIIGAFSLILRLWIGTSSILTMYLGYDVFNLMLFPGSLFMERGPFLLNKYYEVITLLLSIIIVLIGKKYVTSKFIKQDIN